MSSWEASLAVTGNEMKRTKSYFQTTMRKNASFCGRKHSLYPCIPMEDHFTVCTMYTKYS